MQGVRLKDLRMWVQINQKCREIMDNSPGMMQAVQEQAENKAAQTKLNQFFKSNSTVKSSTANNTPIQKDLKTLSDDKITAFEIAEEKQLEAAKLNAAAAKVYQSKALNIKGAKRNETFEAVQILEERKAKVGKGLEFKVQWSKHEPSWESEKTIRPNLDEMIDKFFKENQQQISFEIIVEEVQKAPIENKVSSQNAVCSQNSQQTYLCVKEKDNKKMLDIKEIQCQNQKY